jgi:hypothetical protein
MTPDWGENESARPIPRRVALRIGLGICVLSAAAGVAWYAVSPGVASYQLVVVLVLPLAIIAWLRLRRKLSVRWQWSLAVTVALAGPAGYLVFGGSYWWGACTLTALPLILLIITRVPLEQWANRPRWYGGGLEGPWGPP